MTAAATGFGCIVNEVCLGTSHLGSCIAVTSSHVSTSFRSVCLLERRKGKQKLRQQVWIFNFWDEGNKNILKNIWGVKKKKKVLQAHSVKLILGMLSCKSLIVCIWEGYYTRKVTCTRSRRKEDSCDNGLGWPFSWLVQFGSQDLTVIKRSAYTSIHTHHSLGWVLQLPSFLAWSPCLQGSLRLFNVGYLSVIVYELSYKCRRLKNGPWALIQISVPFP